MVSAMALTVAARTTLPGSVVKTPQIPHIRALTSQPQDEPAAQPLSLLHLGIAARNSGSWSEEKSARERARTRALPALRATLHCFGPGAIAQLTGQHHRPETAAPNRLALLPDSLRPRWRSPADRST